MDSKLLAAVVGVLPRLRLGVVVVCMLMLIVVL